MCKIKQAKIINSTRDYPANKKAYVIRYNHIYIYILYLCMYFKKKDTQSIEMFMYTVFDIHGLFTPKQYIQHPAESDKQVARGNRTH